MVRYKVSLLVLGAVVPFVLGKIGDPSKSVQDVDQKVGVAGRLQAWCKGDQLDDAIQCS